MNKQIKVMVVTSYFYSDSGGVANHTYNLYKFLATDKKYKIIIVASGKNKKKLNSNNLTIYRLAWWFKLSNTPINPLWYFQIRNIINKEKPNIILLHTPVPFMVDLTATGSGKIPYILKYHHGGSMVKGNYLSDIPIRLYEILLFRRLLKKARIIISSSEYVKRTFLNKYQKKVITITPGVDTKKFTAGKKRTGNRILFVANLSKSERYKGLSYLIKAMPMVLKSLPNTKLIVVGGGEDLSYYKRLCSKEGISFSVKFKGRLSGDKLVNQYQNSDVFVLPSLFESTANVLLEAMAAKLPIIASDSTGIPDLVIHNKNGLLFPVKNTNLLAESIVKILSNPQMAKKMGEYGYAMVSSDFTWDSRAKQTKEVIETVLI